jgi:hypothetical protein
LLQLLDLLQLLRLLVLQRGILLLQFLYYMVLW